MQNDRRIALDFEGVCADIQTATYDAAPGLDPSDDDYGYWGFDTEERFEEFMAVSDELWTERPEDVPPCDPRLAEDIGMLRESHEVQILTNRDGHDETILAWLATHGVEVDDIQSNPVGTDKSRFEKDHMNPKGFDFFIDDSPSLAFDVNRLFLVDQPYNQDVEDEDREVVRVGNSGEDALIDVVNELYAGPIRE